MAAPAFHDLNTDSAISAGCVGRFGFCAFEAMPPVGATVTITLPVITRSPFRRSHDPAAARSATPAGAGIMRVEEGTALDPRSSIDAQGPVPWSPAR